jgi:hypothetical protein
MNKISYVEHVQGVGFDWNEALKHPEGFADGHLSDLAANWVTCACGTQCAIIPRNDCGVPSDQELMEHGIIFSARIDKKDWHGAAMALDDIETRSAYLIRDILKKQKT